MNPTPRFVHLILNWPGSVLLARLALVAAFVVSGVTKLANFPQSVAETAGLGLHPAPFWAALTIVVQLGGSALIVSGRLVWLGAGALGIFTGIAALLATAFWAMPEGPARFMAMNAFFEHVGLIGGFVRVAIIADQIATRSAGTRRHDG